jgi:hypothetical protein
MYRLRFALGLFFSSAAVAQIQPLASLPFMVEKNCIYFYCKVNERDSIKFLFDTGADVSVINQKTLDKLPLKISGTSTNQGSSGSHEVESSEGNEIHFGNITRNNIAFIIIPYDNNMFDGVWGTDLMKGYLIVVDYNKQILEFYNKHDTGIINKEFVTLPLLSEVYPSYVKSTLIIQGKKYTGFFGLDTGADDALTLAAPYSKKHDIINKTRKIGSAGFQGSNGVAYEMPIVQLPELLFAEKHLYLIPTALSNVTEGIDATDKLAGFYGNALLQKFNIILDYDRQLVYFKLNKNLYKPYYD